MKNLSKQLHSNAAAEFEPIRLTPESFERALDRHTEILRLTAALATKTKAELVETVLETCTSDEGIKMHLQFIKDLRAAAAYFRSLDELFSAVDARLGVANCAAEVLNDQKADYCRTPLPADEHPSWMAMAWAAVANRMSWTG